MHRSGRRCSWPAGQPPVAPCAVLNQLCPARPPPPPPIPTPTPAGPPLLLQRDHLQHQRHPLLALRPLHPVPRLHDPQAVGHQHGQRTAGLLPGAREPARQGAGVGGVCRQLPALAAQGAAPGCILWARLACGQAAGRASAAAPALNLRENRAVKPTEPGPFVLGGFTDS